MIHFLWWKCVLNQCVTIAVPMHRELGVKP
jgi:hypothetical protein